MCALPRQHLTPEEYLALERQAETKSEYFQGEVFAMAGASSAIHTDRGECGRPARPGTQAGMLARSTAAISG